MTRTTQTFVMRCMPILVLAVTLTILTTGLGRQSAAQEAFETAPTLKASEILPTNLLKGSNFQVQEKVVNDGFINIFTIDSDFGQFKAVSNAKLRQRVGEIYALAQMEKIRQSETFRKSIRESGEDTISGIKNLFTEPKETVTGAVSGVGKAFARAGEALFGSRRSEAEDSRFRSFIGFSKTKRDYAFDFGVDVYSDNEVLQERLNEIAWASYSGGIGYAAALSLVPGAAGVVLSVSGAADLANELYRTTAPTDLRRMNRAKLKAMGVREDAAEIFIDNARYTPRDQTELVLALERMKGTKRGGLFVSFAALTQDRDMALFRQRQARMYAGYHRKVAPIVAFAGIGQVALARTKAGAVLAATPLDYVAWTQAMAKFLDGLDRQIAALPGVSGKEWWLTGSVSPLARQQFEKRGWTVTDNAEHLVTAY